MIVEKIKYINLKYVYIGMIINFNKINVHNHGKCEENGKKCDCKYLGKKLNIQVTYGFIQIKRLASVQNRQIFSKKFYRLTLKI